MPQFAFAARARLLRAAALMLLLSGWCRPGAAQIEPLPSVLSTAQAPSPAGPTLLGAPEPVPAVPQDEVIGQYVGDEPWSWQVLPGSLIWHSYMAGTKEPGFRSVWSTHKGVKVWDITLGGRVGIWRYGNTSGDRPEGWQLDIEGAAMPRLDPAGESTPLIAVDYRFGIQQTYGRGALRAKFGYYHVSSHLGDEFMLANPSVVRINYVRDAAIAGISWYFTDAVRAYGEIAYALGAEDGAKPLEFQYGAEYSPVHVCGFRGAPFAAINAHAYEELDYRGALTVQAGWQWRPGLQGRRFRLGVQYYSGYNEQYEFFNQRENKFGFGLWYDF